MSKMIYFKTILKLVGERHRGHREFLNNFWLTPNHSVGYTICRGNVIHSDISVGPKRDLRVKRRLSDRHLHSAWKGHIRDEPFLPQAARLS